jgi:hypothetical protein
MINKQNELLGTYSFNGYSSHAFHPKKTITLVFDCLGEAFPFGTIAALKLNSYLRIIFGILTNCISY